MSRQCSRCFRALFPVELGPVCCSCDCLEAREATWLSLGIDAGPPLRIERRDHPQGWCVIHSRSGLALITRCGDQGAALGVLDLLAVTPVDWTQTARDVYRRNRGLLSNVQRAVTLADEN